MNLKTTLALLVLVVAGGAFFWLGPLPGFNLTSTAPDPVGAGTLTVLEQEVEPAQLSKIEIRSGDQVILLERSPDGEWTLPGKWPTRKPEVDALIGILTGLRSRFAPIPLEDESNLSNYGLEKPAVTVTAHAGDETYILAFGEPAAGEETNRFSRPTYLRLGITTQGQLEWKPETIRLAPGLIAVLDRPADYYQQRRLFPSERIAKEDNSQEKVDRLVAKSIAIEEKKADGSKFTLDRQGDDWVLNEPVHDRPDPDKLTAILNAVPDIWADQFVSKPKKDLAEYGLNEPEQTIRITRPSGEAVTLLIGKVAQTKTRTVMRPAPPVGQPMPPQPQIIHEEYRYAKLKDNDQIFEINADKLKDVFVNLDTLRDARLARFRADDAKRIEIDQKGQEIVLVKDKDRWKLQKPIESDAENSKVTELLDKLSNLRTGGKEDVIDKKEPKEYGLDAPAATVKITVEEEVKGGDKKAKKTRTFTVKLGKHDTEKSKLYAQLDGWERINAVEDSLLKLVQRPALAYRGRRIFDFSRNNLAQVDVQRGEEKYRIKSIEGVWRLAEPVDAEADSVKTGQLAGDLGQLEAVEYASEEAKPEDLEKKYGLDKPSLSAKLTFTDKDKPAQTLLIGKQLTGKPEYYAKLEDKPSVFVVKKDIHDVLDQSSLAFRPTQLWQLQAEEIGELRIQRSEEPEYRLTREGEGEKAGWKVSGPFDAKVSSTLVRKMLTDLGQLRCERYEANAAKELEKYGLDKPQLKLTVIPIVKKDDDKKKEKEKEPTERTLLVGKKTDKEPPGYYAKLEKGDAVVVIGSTLVAAVDHAALDLLDRSLLKVDTKAVSKIKSTSGDATVTLERKDEGWQVDTGAAPAFKADGDIMTSYLGVWSVIRAQKFAAYGPKADLANFGLDKPTVTITATLQPADAKDKPTEHTIVLGKEADGGGRYARIDNGPGVVVLSVTDASDLSKTYLDFVERTLLKLDPSKITALQRKMGEQELEIARKDDGWHLVKPAELLADAATVDALIDQLAKLRVVRVAAYPAKDLKPYGVDEPDAVVTLRLTDADGKAAERVLKVGKLVGDKSEDRFVQVDGSDVVGVADGKLARRLVAAPLFFRDRNLARFADADRAILERGPRKAVFAKVDGTWKLTEPVEADAEQSDLEEFVNALARLRADELVVEKPEDLKPYGLVKPRVRWHFQVGEKDVLGLLIGAHEKIDGKDGPRCYAKLTNSDLVFLLDPRLTTRALAEYRNRTLWPSLDSAQVERLDYHYLRNPFVLEKVDNVWQVAGKPNLKVKTEAVSDALAALATLRAEFTVVDKDAIRKIYGLEPPQLVLEAQTPTGKRVLQVGLQVGDSKRYYAHVVDDKRNDVFVLSEADAARIVRDLAGFTQSAAKP